MTAPANIGELSPALTAALIEIASDSGYTPDELMHLLVRVVLEAETPSAVCLALLDDETLAFELLSKIADLICLVEADENERVWN